MMLPSDVELKERPLLDVASPSSPNPSMVGQRVVDISTEPGDETDGLQLGSTMPGAVHRFIYHPAVQVALVVTLLVDFIFIILQFLYDNAGLVIVTLLTSTILAVELFLRYRCHREHYFVTHRVFKTIEFVIVPLSLVLEIIEVILAFEVVDLKNADTIIRALRLLRTLRWLRLVRIFVLWRQRFSQASASMRKVVSADRRRYQESGFDLDLTYITGRLIAMSWPSTGIEALYRNHIDDVALYFKLMHKDHFWIYCLTSERKYDHKKFANRVTRIPMDDHNPVELDTIFDFLTRSQNFLDEDPSNVIVVHCKGGKGRTGTLMCAFLLKHGIVSDADEALNLFGTIRTSDKAKKFQGVESPSQARYVGYVDQLLKDPTEGSAHTQFSVSSFVLRNFNFRHFNKLERLWFVLISKPSSERHVIYKSNDIIAFNPHVPETSAEKKGRGRPFKTGMERCTGYSVDFGGGDVVPFSPRNHASISARLHDVCDNHVEQWPSLVIDVRAFPCPISKDLVVKFFYDVNNPHENKPEFSFWVYPALERTIVTMGLEDIDGPHKPKNRKKFRPNFEIEVKFEPAS